MDGSAKDFYKEKIEVKTTSKKRKYIKNLNKVYLVDGDKKISIEPNDFHLKLIFNLNYENKIINKQRNI